ncbi:MAG: hypothetical protein LUJ09_03280 [Firmicutes bacterium]|nr:hypothetical protein [Bacillota bacterium]
MKKAASGKASQPKQKTRAEILRDNKIEAYRARIRSSEQTISSLQADQQALALTGVTGLPVTHKAFGSGAVTAQEGATITVTFPTGEKRFVMPSAFFSGFLTTEDPQTLGRLSQYRQAEEQIRSVREEIVTAERAIRILESKTLK